tara:strand:- start:1824 stop:2060 length:237 start_codon:yes stop_codon:yes gene_type:complete
MPKKNKSKELAEYIPKQLREFPQARTYEEVCLEYNKRNPTDLMTEVQVRSVLGHAMLKLRRKASLGLITDPMEENPEE